ncbi:hypothetical protein OIE50_50850 [Streptomyces canus]|uniref:hypothetical protein n=1 Tax=Streptomyces canus TaxID=58343 RepID=UPI00324A413B
MGRYFGEVRNVGTRLDQLRVVGARIMHGFAHERMQRRIWSFEPKTGHAVLDANILAVSVFQTSQDGAGGLACFA